MNAAAGVVSSRSSVERPVSLMDPSSHLLDGFVPRSPSITLAARCAGGLSPSGLDADEIATALPSESYSRTSPSWIERPSPRTAVKTKRYAVENWLLIASAMAWANRSSARRARSLRADRT